MPNNTSSKPVCPPTDVQQPWFTRFNKAIAMALGAVGLWLGFPNDIGQISPLILLYPMALVYLGEKAHSSQEALRHGWLTGILGCTAALYWLAIPIHYVGGMPWALAIPCALAMGAYIGLYAGVYSLAAHVCHKYMAHEPMAKVIALGCLWYGLELLRGTLLTGFPWLTLSAAFAPYPVLIQGASLFGTYALSAYYVTFSLCLYACFQSKITWKARIPAMALSSLLCAMLVLWGLYSLHWKPQEQGSAFPVIMVEGNIDQNIKWEPQLQEATLDTYIRLSTEALHAMRLKSPQAQPLLIWPETAMPFFVEQHPVFGPKLQKFVRQAHTPLITGAPAINVDPSGQNRPFNRAYFISDQGGLWGYYDKVHLVPFGEYVPMWLKWNFLEGLLQSIGAFSVGTQEKPLKNMASSPSVSLALGMLICYEGIFPELAQKRVQDGANILVNISNDGWFGDSSAPEQHLQLTSMRAVEQGRWLIRNTNTGISAIIDATGTVRLRGSQFVAQSLDGEAQTQTKNTLFHAIYAYIPWTFLGIFLVCLGIARRTIRHKN